MSIWKERLFFCVAFFLLLGGAWGGRGVLAKPSATASPLGIRQQAIIGGVRERGYPAVGVMTTRSFEPFCSGTLIAPRLVLTAAHCIDLANAYGIKQFRFRFDVFQGERLVNEFFLVKRVILHPEWVENGPPPYLHDLALLELVDSVPSIRPLALHSATLDETWLNREIKAVGYGLIQTRPQIESTRDKHSQDFPIQEIQETVFRVFREEKSPCSGDSGGPALVEEAGEARIVGVVSYVLGTLATTTQHACDGSAVYIRTDAYRAWMQPYIDAAQASCSQDDECAPNERCGSRDAADLPCDAQASGACLCFQRGNLQENDFCSLSQRCSDGLRCLDDPAAGMHLCQRQGCQCQALPFLPTAWLPLALALLALVSRRRNRRSRKELG